VLYWGRPCAITKEPMKSVLASGVGKKRMIPWRTGHRLAKLGELGHKSNKFESSGFLLPWWIPDLNAGREKKAGSGSLSVAGRSLASYSLEVFSNQPRKETGKKNMEHENLQKKGKGRGIDVRGRRFHGVPRGEGAS